MVAPQGNGQPVNVKAQFLAAHEMGHIIRKFEEAGTSRFYSVSGEVRLQQLSGRPFELWHHEVDRMSSGS